MTLSIEEAQAMFQPQPLIIGLAQAQDLVHAINVEKGWYNDTRTFGDDIALLHSEVSEMLEEFRSHGLAAYVQDEGNPAYIKQVHEYPAGYKPLGVPSEAADVLVRLLDTCHRYGINLAEEFIAKTSYNATRPFRHGNKAL